MRSPSQHRARLVAVAAGVVALVLSAWSLIARHGSHGAQSQAEADRSSGTKGVATARFVGQATCGSCHAREASAWKGSHHELAMQPAEPSTVLGDFSDARLEHGGVTSRLFRRGEKYIARTDGPDGAVHDYEITHTFGVSPLQQYLVAFPGGRRQALEIAWDSRAATDGGQRWFHLYPGERLSSGDPLHWTGVAENWNYMCADCHSTNVRKSWSPEARAYATRFDEESVSCEACHGPGALHVAWANQRPEGRQNDVSKGLLITLDERKGVAWPRNPATGKPARSAPRSSEREIETCARCHSRRGLVHEDHVHGQPVADDYRVALLDDDLYYPDGQAKGEVYEYGSFLQSRMYAEGVSCSDCHDPHRLELRASGDEVCLQCHSRDAYASTKHHLHAPASPGARCVGCHMPATIFMVVDARRDHSLRVPRPDLSVKLGVPNACNGCHTNRSAEWAARTVAGWYGHAPTGFQQFAEALARGTQGASGAEDLLAALVADRGQPAIARASALARMARPTSATIPVVRSALGDASALVRRAAVHAAADIDPQLRSVLVAPLLDDPVRTVRIEAAAALAGVPMQRSPVTRRALDRATAELVAAEELNGDRPEAHLNLATLYEREAQLGMAESELGRALSMDPSFVPALVNLVDLYRIQGRDAAGERLVREGLERMPEEPALLHALGLVLVRQRRASEALKWLGVAAHSGADEPRYGYVYAVALHDAGRTRDALSELERVLARHPYDRDSLAALTLFCREAGEPHKADAYAVRLEALDPRSP